MEKGITEEMLEKERLEKTLKVVKERLKEVSAIKEGGRSEVISQRREFMKNTTSVIYDFDDVIELNTLNQFVNEQERNYGEALRKYNILQKLQNSPYFARIDFQENGDDYIENIYIGIASIYDEETYESYIYDWRAPISSMFYDYDLGKAQYKSPMGIVEGKITLKRQYKIEDGKL